MSDTLIAVKPEIAAKALVDAAKYKAMCQQADADPDAFWRAEADRIT